jgi:UDP:flavonoid glycosyltransferase YjiC (YdhE family)
MRVLFIPFPLPTHYLHQVPLAWALRAAGHEVRIAAAHENVRETIIKSGMIAVEVGGAYNLMGALAQSVQIEQDRPLEPGEFQRKHRTLLDEYGKVAELMATDMVTFSRWWKPDLVITDPLVTIAPLVSESIGVPLVRHLFGPDVIRHMGLPGSGKPVEGDVREAWPSRLVEIYDRFKVEVRADYAVGTVDNCPPSVQLPGVPNRLPVRYVPYNGAGVAPSWLRRQPERPRVCVTWGTVTSRLKGAEGFQIPAILDALASLDVEVVAALSAADRELLGQPPAGVRVVEQLPLHLLLPTCDALVQQGGTGAMLTAASFGVPQVIVAQIRDEIFNADLLAASGAGLGLRAATIDADQVKVGVSALLGDTGLRAAATRLREEMAAMPTPADLVRTLEPLVDR